VLATVLAAAGWTGCGSGETAQDAVARPLPDRAVLGPVVAVGKPGFTLSSVALGEGGVWVGGGAHDGGVVTRVDPRSGRRVASIGMPYYVAGVAAGAGGVWTAGATCLGPHPEDPDVCLTEPRVSRIDPDSERLVATIRVPRPAGVPPDSAQPSAVAMGEGAVWVAVSWTALEGEVIRIDPSTNTIAARIPTGGYVGDVRVAAGSVWVLSHREYTDETKVRGASLLRIDPARNSVVATPIRDELTFLGGAQIEIPPVMAAGEDAVWITSPSAAKPTLAFRVDTETNEVARERLPVERFYPVAVEAGAVWFIGATGRGFTLERLDPRTLEPTVVTKLPIYAVRAVLDPTTDTFWTGSLVLRHNERPKLVRVELR
jgi:hypothetical protein